MAWKLNSKFQFQLKSETFFMKKTKNFTKPFGQAWHQIVLRFSFSLILLGALEINFDQFQFFINLTFGLSSYLVKLNPIFKKLLVIPISEAVLAHTIHVNMLYFDRVRAFLPAALDINVVNISKKIGLSKIRCMSWPENHTRNFNFKLNEKNLWKTKNFTKPFGQAWHPIVLRFSFSLILLGALEINFDQFQTFKNLTFGLSSYVVKLNPFFKKILVIPISEAVLAHTIYVNILYFDRVRPFLAGALDINVVNIYP